MKCPKCGSDNAFDSVTGQAAVEEWRCPACGLVMHVHTVPVVPDDIHHSSALVDLVLWWSQVPPPAKEVLALRRHFEDFATIPVNELRRRLEGGERRLVIGRFIKGQADRLLDSAKESGLDLRIEPTEQG